MCVQILGNTNSFSSPRSCCMCCGTKCIQGLAKSACQRGASDSRSSSAPSRVRPASTMCAPPRPIWSSFPSSKVSTRFYGRDRPTSRVEHYVLRTTLRVHARWAPALLVESRVLLRRAVGVEQHLVPWAVRSVVVERDRAAGAARWRA